MVLVFVCSSTIHPNAAAYGDERVGTARADFLWFLRNRPWNRPSSPRPPGVDPLADFESHGLNRRFKGGPE